MLERHTWIMGFSTHNNNPSSFTWMNTSWACQDSNSACVLSIDMVGFTLLSIELGPSELVQLMHSIWCIMDDVVQEDDESKSNSSSSCDGGSDVISHPIKMDTVGDAYIVVVTMKSQAHHLCVQAATSMLRIAANIAQGIYEYSRSGPHNLTPGKVKIRLGMCVDDVVAGVVGFSKPRYHVFGEAVNRAKELESGSSAFHVLVGQEVLKTCSSVLNTQLVDLICKDHNPNFMYELDILNLREGQQYFPRMAASFPTT